MRELMKRPDQALEWDPNRFGAARVGGPTQELRDKLTTLGWVRGATAQEWLDQNSTVESLRSLCRQHKLRIKGDKAQLVARVCAALPILITEQSVGHNCVMITEAGLAQMNSVEARDRVQAVEQDRDVRSRSLERLVRSVAQFPGSRIEVTGHPWSNCVKLPDIVGIYDPRNVPLLPPVDCPKEVCNCWQAWPVYPGEQPKRDDDTRADQPDVIDVTARTPTAATWIHTGRSAASGLRTVLYIVIIFVASVVRGCLGLSR